MKLDQRTRHARNGSSVAAPNTPEPGKHTLTSQLPVQRSQGTEVPGPRAVATGTSAPAPSAVPHIPLERLFGSRPAQAQGGGDLHAAPVQRAAAGEPTGRELPSDGAGKAMPAEIQAKMESALGADFSGVRIHEGPRSAALGARAFTQGTDVHFAPGEYRPDSQAGQALLGHELAHVVQQRQGRVQATTQAKGTAVNDDAGLEREADELGARAAQGERIDGEVATGPAQASMSGIVQRVKWDGWEARLKSVSPGTASKAKLGMCLVNWLRERGIHGRIGGSLSAAMFGGRREPRDIDIDIPGDDLISANKNLNEAKDRFHNFIQRPNISLGVGNDLFFITDWSKTSDGYKLEYLQVETDRPLDLLEDDEEICKVRSQIKSGPSTVTVDFSSEAAFRSSGINIKSGAKDPGYYDPDFLIASYLNRLATNLSESKPDKKRDREQVDSLLSSYIRAQPQETRPRSSSDIAKFLERVKHSIVSRYISDSNPRAKDIDLLFVDIIHVVSSETPLREIPSLPMHETRSREMDLPDNLINALGPLVLRLNL